MPARVVNLCSAATVPARPSTLKSIMGQSSARRTGLRSISKARRSIRATSDKIARPLGRRLFVRKETPAIFRQPRWSAKNLLFAGRLCAPAACRWIRIFDLFSPILKERLSSQGTKLSGGRAARCWRSREILRLPGASFLNAGRAPPKALAPVIIQQIGHHHPRVPEDARFLPSSWSNRIFPFRPPRSADRYYKIRRAWQGDRRFFANSELQAKHGQAAQPISAFERRKMF